MENAAGHAWKARVVVENASSHGKHCNHGKRGKSWKTRVVMENEGGYGKCNVWITDSSGSNGKRRYKRVFFNE